MRVLYVLEALGDKGDFMPKVGFGAMEFLELWIKNHLPAADRMSAEWRIVKYVPLESEDSTVH